MLNSELLRIHRNIFLMLESYCREYVSIRLFYLLVLLAPNFSLGASFTDEELESIDRGNRYEGLITKPVSARFQFLALLAGEVPEFHPNGELYVHFYNTRDNNSIQLLGQRLRSSDTLYYMRAKKSDWNSGESTFGPWPVSEVLNPLEISNRNLGVLISTSDKLYLPAQLMSEESDLSSSEYKFWFHTPEDIELLQWSVDDEAGNMLLSGEQSAIWPNTSIKIESRMEGQPSGEYKLQLAIKWPNGSSRFTYRFWHQHSS